MTKYLALLRGINVGGHRIIKMDYLRELFRQLHFEDISTYIQSGNVIFHAAEPDPGNIERSIESHLEEQLEYKVDVMVITYDTLEKISRQCPFPVDDLSKQVKVYVSFLKEKPGHDRVEDLESRITEKEKFRVIGQALYIRCIKDGSKLQFSNTFVERILKVKSTNRNWNSVMTLIEKF